MAPALHTYRGDPAAMRWKSNADVLLCSMLAPEDLPPTHARVMKITKPTSSSSASTSTSPFAAIANAEPDHETEPPTLVPPMDEKVSKYSDDYTSEDSDEGEEDDGWNVVKSKPKREPPITCLLSPIAYDQMVKE